MKSTTIRAMIFAVIGTIFLFGVANTSLHAVDNKVTSKPVTIRLAQQRNLRGLKMRSSILSRM
jgi:hypothetical protein